MRLLGMAFLLCLTVAARAELPTDGMILHLEASDLSAAGDGGAISGTWADRSAEANDVTASGSPTYDADGIGGLPAVEFASGGYFTLPTDYKPTVLDAYIVARLSSAASFSAPFATDRFGSGNLLGMSVQINTARRFSLNIGDNSGSGSSSRAGRLSSDDASDLIPLTTDLILHARFTEKPYACTAAWNGRDVVHAGAGGNLNGTGGALVYQTTAAGRIGANAVNGFLGRMAEVVMYDELLSGPEHRRVMRHLARKYGIDADVMRGAGTGLLTVTGSDAWSRREHLSDAGHPRFTEYGGDPDRTGSVAGHSAVITRSYDGSEYRIVAHYDEVRNLVIHVSVDGGAWTTHRYDGDDQTQLYHQGDNHNYIALEVDSGGTLHVFLDQHNNAAKYYQSNAALDTWTGTLSSATADLLGTNESSLSYPVMFPGQDGYLWGLIFRDGGSGDGDLYFYEWNGTDWDAGPATGTAGLLVDGKNSSPDMNPYALGPPQWDSEGRLWLGWVWRETTAASTNRDPSAMRLEADESEWQELDGTTVTTDVAHAATPIIESVSTGEDLVGNMSSLAIDDEDVPHFAYFRDDGSDVDQIYHAFANGTSWSVEAVSSYASEGGRPDTFSSLTMLAGGKALHILVRESTANSGTGLHQLVRYTKIGAGSWTRTVVASGEDLRMWGPMVDRHAWQRKREIVMLSPSDDNSRYSGQDLLEIATRAKGRAPGATDFDSVFSLSP